MKPRKTLYYKSFQDDFFESNDQNYTLPDDYEWVKNGLLDRVWSAILYGVAVLFSTVYCRLVLHLRFKNRSVLKQANKAGAFIYANHTQPIGDVFIPALACLPRRINTVVSPANLGLRFIGKLLTPLGALPVPNGIRDLKKLNEAIEYRLRQKRYILIYPEAHVWEYCTDIRPFGETSFGYPVMFDKPTYCMTATYQKSRIFRRPTMTVFVDGPFYPDGSLGRRERTKKLHREISECMKKRSKSSNYSYIRYEREAQ